MAKYLEEYKAWSGKNQAHEAAKLSASQKRVFELEQQFTHLQSLKTEDELVIQSMAGQIEALKQERDYLHTELSSSLNNQRMASAASVDLVSDLAKYDIWLWGANSLSFGDQWLQLWNQYVSEDPQAPDRGLSQNDRVTPKELAILLENFASQVRRDKDRIQSQQETISSLGRDREYLFSLYNNDPKALPYSAPTEMNSQTPDSEIQTSSPYSFSGHRGEAIFSSKRIAD
ncbi:hypothetical protein GALMADRAFT_239941 [Galerina marginata CBS 339.88]|uniref:Uncharacterized protein n=1 Tax=Galerina marginata (strain CBS 339.88) TaxID=685588 RepID=A0A067TRY9_GALM3|nr:hypothetical protein GALMADRAFT_239941 [Galerina marginata CBS 339.88]